MQLRVARLCLDCEELYVGDGCPVCASDRYAFLSTWLPTEERRRWRRGAPRQAAAPQSGVVRAWRQVRQWLGAPKPDVPSHPKTRASDHLPPFDFGDPESATRERPRLDPHPAQVSRENGH
jgi:hypothetical protein